MNFRLIALAAMAASTGAAQAAIITPAQLDAARNAGTLKEIRIHGASAQQRMVGSYMQSICNSDYTTYFDTTAGSNHRAYACTLNKKVGNFNAGTLVFVNKRDAGGSIFGVSPIALNVAENSMQVTDAGCVATGNNPDVNVAAYTCGTVALQAAHAGLSDVEPARFMDVVKAGGVSVNLNLPAGVDDNGTAWTVLTSGQLKNLDVGTVNQTLFGIAVNVNLRNALQQAQGLNVGSDALADTPWMPRAFYAAAIAGFVKGGNTSGANWKSLTGIAGDDIKQVNICRRANGSGTQASSNLFFANAATINDEAAGMLFPKTATGALAINGTLAVIENSSTGAVATCLTNSALGSTGYAMGIISYEVDPGAAAWRFVSIDGSFPSQAAARVGAYPYVYSASMQFNKSVVSADQKAFLTQFRAELASPTIIATLDPSPRKGVLGNPNAYAGNCASATGANLTDGSCVERLDFNSAFNDNSYINGNAAKKNFLTNSSQPLHFVK